VDGVADGDADVDEDADGVGAATDEVVEALGVLVAEGVEGVGVALGVALLGDAVGEADLVDAPLGLVVGCLGSLTWVMVVPSPPESAWPEISSNVVSAAAAMANAARVPTTMLFQLRPRPAAGLTRGVLAGVGARGWVGAQELVVGWVPVRTSMLVGSPLDGAVLVAEVGVGCAAPWPVRPLQTVRTLSWVCLSEAV
jgi:hypothetical protein